MRAYGWIVPAVMITVAACDRKPLTAGAATCATVESQHPGVEVMGAAGSAPVVRAGRVEVAGRVRTAPEGRAVVRTDDGLELRVAGNSEVVFADGRARVERGRVFVSSWGDGERAFGVGPDAVIHLADAALAVERGVEGARGRRRWSRRRQRRRRARRRRGGRRPPARPGAAPPRSRRWRGPRRASGRVTRTRAWPR